MIISHYGLLVKRFPPDRAAVGPLTAGVARTHRSHAVEAVQPEADHPLTELADQLHQLTAAPFRV